MEIDHRLKRLTGKVAAVTGAGRNIGKAIATRLAEEGASIVIADIAEDAGQSVADLLGRRNFPAAFYPTDVTNTSDAEALVSFAIARFGQLDIMVNNAGIASDAWLMKMTDKQWRDVIDIDLDGVFHCLRAAARHMAERRSGRIINISSIAYLGNRGISNYAAAKAGVLGLTRCAALELAGFGITVNAVAPGLIDTGLFYTIPERLRHKYLERIPCHELGTPGDVAAVAAFLASDDARYVQGQVLNVCGGLSVGII